MPDLRDREQQRQGLMRLQQAVKRPTHLVDLDEEVPAVALRIDDTDLEVVYVVGEYDIWRNTNPDNLRSSPEHR